MTADPDGGDLAKSDEILLALQRGILLGDRPVGSWLRHAALAEEFGTSRTPVREALRVLHAQGIVSIVKNRGARVNGHSSHDIRELGEVRSVLEGFAAGLAAQRITDDQVKRMEAAWRDFDLDPGTDDRARRWAESNNAFHSVIVEASGNRQLSLSIQDIHGRLPANSAYAAYAGSTQLLRRNLAEHAAVANAVVNGDPDAARDLMTSHILSSVDATIRWAEEQHLLRRQDTA
ncbi:GntR family transcriptional regulator [Kribbella sp. NBC_01505]|uniref:GntR family transcriptional regulator n=1 Tax=Kribbella sp. NBC_01505 TaxID=2903580 RepID=UPI003868184F